MGVAKSKTNKFITRTNFFMETPPVIVDFVKNLFVLLFATHLYSCIWYFAGTFLNERASWIDNYCPSVRDFDDCLGNSQNEGNFIKHYIASTYWVLTTFSTV